MAPQRWCMSWYPGGHTVKILHSIRGKSCAVAVLSLCNTQQDALLVTLIPLKEISSWDREVDLVTTYKRVVRTLERYIVFKTETTLHTYCFLAQY